MRCPGEAKASSRLDVGRRVIDRLTSLETGRVAIQSRMIAFMLLMTLDPAVTSQTGHYGERLTDLDTAAQAQQPASQESEA